MRALSLITVLLAATACATASSGKPLTLQTATTPPPAEFKAKGSFVTRGNSVSYDDHRIVGPFVDIALQNGSEWAGSAFNQRIRLAVDSAGGVIGGTGAKLAFTRNGDTVHVEGQWNFRRIRIDVAPTHLLLRDDTRTFDLTQKAPGCFGEAQREGCVVKVLGDANKMPDAAMPQFAIALITAFSTANEQVR